MVCHSRAANFVLGLSTAQMNKEHDYGGTIEHQFRVLEQLDLLKKRRIGEADRGSRSFKLPQLVNPYDESEPLEARARSYLHANCSICHMQAGGGNAQMDLEYSASLQEAERDRRRRRCTTNSASTTRGSSRRDIPSARCCSIAWLTAAKAAARCRSSRPTWSISRPSSSSSLDPLLQPPKTERGANVCRDDSCDWHHSPD